jgi:RNA polymerase sigma-70 factor (ECF subfamily)
MSKALAVAISSQTRTNAEWLSDLQGTGPVQAQALQELRDYLVRVAVIYLERRWEHLAGLEHAELLQLAQDLAQEALLDILNKLDAFRGESRFTTWAYKFVINVAAEELRRRRWQNISLETPLPIEDLPPLANILPSRKSLDPEKAVLRKAVWESLRRIVAEELTERQRTVLIAVILQEAPVEDVARQLETTPNNVYKILHDARRKLKRRLLDEAITPEYVRELFSEGG